MYTGYFRFKKKPFHITPDPEFLFLSPSHREASAAIIYGIEQRKGFLAVVGEVGVGKTTILRSYLEDIDPERLKVVYLFNAGVSFRALLKLIFQDLGIPDAEGDTFELVNRLHHYLIEEYQNDRNVVLIVDEAQNMPVETLENLRMLSNLETSKDKLIQILMVGQPELENLLNLPELRQLKQRIAVLCKIRPLSREESLAYIQHRLMKASGFHNLVFTKNALNRIVKHAGGIPRVINIVCDNALMTAFGYHKNPVSGKIVKEVISDLSGRRRFWLFRWPFAAITTVAVIAGAIFAGFTRIEEKAPVPANVVEIQRNTADAAPVSARAANPVQAPAPVVEELVKPVQPVPAAVQPEPAAVQPEPTVVQPVPAVVQPEPVVVQPEPVAVQPERVVVQPEPLVEARASAPGAGGPVADRKNIGSAPGPSVVSAREDTGVIRVTAKRGDSVTGLLVQRYGYCDQRLLKIFMEFNPQVTDIDIIRTGEVIILPQRASSSND